MIERQHSFTKRAMNLISENKNSRDRSIDMAEAAVSSAVGTARTFAFGMIELLKGELKAMQSFLKDANRKQAQDETVRNWISDIRAAARDAEDIIDVFLIKVESARSRKLLERCSSFAKRVFHRYRIGREIQSVRARLAAIDERRRRYRIEGSEDTAADLARSSEVALRRRLSPWQIVEHLVGVEEDVKKLLRNSILNEENKGLSFALVEGMGGIGKSTVARAVFDHPEVAGGGFECREWVVVSSEFNVKETIKQVIFKVQKCEEDEKKMLEKFQKLEETMKDEQFIIDELEQLLCKQLEGKTYFSMMCGRRNTWNLSSVLSQINKVKEVECW